MRRGHRKSSGPDGKSGAIVGLSVLDSATESPDYGGSIAARPHKNRTPSGSRWARSRSNQWQSSRRSPVFFDCLRNARILVSLPGTSRWLLSDRPGHCRSTLGKCVGLRMGFGRHEHLSTSKDAPSRSAYRGDSSVVAVASEHVDTPTLVIFRSRG